MLSIENPPPAADPLPCQLNKNNNNKTVGYNEKKKQQQQLPNLPDNIDPSSSSSASSFYHHHNPIPSFSIRDYVFSSRSKDIKKNWPFSLENLQLCFKHGIKDPLPTFQTFDAVKNQSFRRCMIEASLSEKKAVVSDVEGEPLGGVYDDHQLDDAQANHKLVDQSGKCRSRLENELPSISTSVQQSEIEYCEADQTVLETPTVNPPLPRKNDNSSKPVSKKCKLVVKFGSLSSEEIASNSTVVSESMASKVCPVCKTFSSSSNTTLNAHIDQCLSSSSTPKLAADSKQTRHKIKPRKIRLMTDIYLTAKRCTLEELDRRNGTSWASLAGSMAPLVTDKFNVPNEGENQRVSPVCSNEVAGDAAPVYIDASGTKVRILSKLNDATIASKADKNIEAKKSLKGGKEGKFFSSKKKSRHGKKRHKYLKLIPQSRKLFFEKGLASQVSSGVEEHSSEGSCKKDKLQKMKHSKPVHPPGASKQCVPSKHVGLIKELNKQGCKRSQPAENGRSCLTDSLVRGNTVRKLTGLSGNTDSSLENCYTTGRGFEEVRVFDNMERAVLQRKRSPDHSGKVSESTRECPVQRTKENNRKFVPYPGRKKLCLVAANYSDSSPSTSMKKSVVGTPAFRSKTSKFSSPEKNCSAMKRTRLHLTVEADEEYMARQSKIDQECNLMHNGSDDLGEGEMVLNDKSFGTSAVTSRDNGEVADSSLKDDLHDDDDDENDDNSDDDENDDNSDDDDDDVLENFDGLETTEGRATTGLSKFLHTLSDSPQSACDYPGASCTPSFLGTQELYISDEVGNGIPGENVHMGMELDSEVGQESSFPEVEPIPIPGPPGSFLPSPRDMMGSDDFPGNSSLTTSPVESSEDYHEFIDRNSSGSPISMASTISNSTVVKSDHLRYLEQSSSAGVDSIQEKIISGFHTADLESAVDSAERYYNGDKLDINKISVEKKPFSLGNDNQPCCCQRKDRSSHGFITLNFQESQLLRRRTMNFVTAPAPGRQMSVDPNTKSGNLDLTPDMVPLCSWPVSGPDKVTTIPMVKPLAEPNELKRSPDCASPSPAASNSVLRLMGKNLMVINREEDVSVPLNQAEPSPKTVVSPTLQFSPVPSMSPPGFPSRGINSFHPVAPQGSCDALGMLDMGNNFRTNTNLREPPNSAQVPSISCLGSLPAAESYSSRNGSSFHSFKPHESSIYSGAPMMQMSFNAVPMKRTNTSPVRVGCIPEGSGKTHLGSALYYS